MTYVDQTPLGGGIGAMAFDPGTATAYAFTGPPISVTKLALGAGAPVIGASNALGLANLNRRALIDTVNGYGFSNAPL